MKVAPKVAPMTENFCVFASRTVWEPLRRPNRSVERTREPLPARCAALYHRVRTRRFFGGESKKTLILWMHERNWSTVYESARFADFDHPIPARRFDGAQRYTRVWCCWYERNERYEVSPPARPARTATARRARWINSAPAWQDAPEAHQSADGLPVMPHFPALVNGSQGRPLVRARVVSGP